MYAATYAEVKCIGDIIGRLMADTRKVVREQCIFLAHAGHVRAYLHGMQPWQKAMYSKFHTFLKVGGGATKKPRKSLGAVAPSPLV